MPLVAVVAEPVLRALAVQSLVAEWRRVVVLAARQAVVVTGMLHLDE